MISARAGRGAPGQPMPRRYRWGFAVVGVLVLLTLVSAGARSTTAPAVSDFATRPGLRPPEVDVFARGAAPGYVFVTPSPAVGESPPRGSQTGPLIVDGSGEPVWFGPTGPAEGNDLSNLTSNFKVQRYRGEPVLTWWQGRLVAPPGLGYGRYVIMDSSYRRIGTVGAGDGLRADLHEFVITPRGTALITAYPEVDTPDNGGVYAGVVQEVDIATGRVLFQWNSLDHVPLSESIKPRRSPSKPWDYFHINSVGVDSDGNLLVSARHTSTVYKIDRDTGSVIWRLGGTNSDFRMGPRARFGYQHDARRRPDGTITIFDNGPPIPGYRSRAITLRLDERAMTAELAREYPSPEGWYSFSQGNVQRLAGGHTFVGWGSQPYVTEFAGDGEVVFNAVFGPNMASYRAYRLPWTGRPYYPPTVALRPGPDGGVTVHASWNGATEVARWRVLTGPDPQRLAPVADASADGFETAIELDDRGPFVAVQALNRSGDVLRTSLPVAAAG